MTDQKTFPAFGSPWNPVKPDLRGYTPPEIRSRPAARSHAVPLVTVMGTVRNEREEWLRSWQVWKRQRLPDWLTVRFLVLDDGSDDGIKEVIEQEKGIRNATITYIKMREPDTPSRSCTLVFNEAISRGFVITPLVLVQWWDRIPGSVHYLRKLVEPHRKRPGIATSGVSRHIGASASHVSLEPDELANRLSIVPWETKPETLDRVSGPIGNHCIPGKASESSALCIATDELRAIGGWDPRYQSQHSYANVELFRRLLQSGLIVSFVPEPHGANYHQTAPGGRKTIPLGEGLSDPRVRRNGID